MEGDDWIIEGAWAHISRDPFARQDLVRRVVTTPATCTWCGSQRRSRKLFEYGGWPDGSRMQVIRGLFCSITCMRSYHNKRGNHAAASSRLQSVPRPALLDRDRGRVPVVGLMDGKYRVYAGKLDPQVIPWNQRARFKRACYVGSTAKPQRVRWEEHLSGYLCCTKVYEYGLCLMPSLTKHLKPFWTREGAERAERRLARELRKAGWYVIQG